MSLLTTNAFLRAGHPSRPGVSPSFHVRLAFRKALHLSAEGVDCCLQCSAAPRDAVKR